MTVEGSEFVRRFLQHVLPAGFQKVRHYGFLSPNAKVSIDLVRWLIALSRGLIFALWGYQAPQAAPRPQPRCPMCGQSMRVLGFRPATMTDPVPFDTS
jgi:hypothetical protein